MLPDKVRAGHVVLLPVCDCILFRIFQLYRVNNKHFFSLPSAVSDICSFINTSMMLNSHNYGPTYKCSRQQQVFHGILSPLFKNLGKSVVKVCNYPCSCAYVVCLGFCFVEALVSFALKDALITVILFLILTITCHRFLRPADKVSNK